MKYPTLRAQSRYRLRVPALSGGVNWQDEAGLVSDDQLTDCCNLWWENGGLRTRPGLRIAGDPCFYAKSGGLQVSRSFTGLMQGHDSFAVERHYNADSETAYYYPKRISPDGQQVTGLGNAMKLYGMGGEIPSFLLVIPPQSEEERTELYGFGSSPDGVTLCRKTVGSETWTEAKPYIPTVLINGGERGEGTAYEGYNLLTGAFRCRYTTNGTLRRFYLPRKELTSNVDEPVTISYVSEDGTAYDFSVPSPATADYAYSAGVAVGGQTVYARVDYSQGRVTFWKSLSDTADTNSWTPPDAGVNNNLTVVAYKTDSAAGRRIGGMTFSAWFGGSTGSLKTGTRLFVSGHPEFPGLVHWSDINNPLYFPENNYAYVGGTGEAVTAFGKQSDMLVIFKQHSLYAMTYTEGSYTAADLTAGAVVDVTAASALFPVRQLHPAIGCDLPATVALCQNRLVWTTSDGRVHMLLSASGYSDSNVRELGRQIDPQLKTALAGTTPVCAVAWQGRYVLLAGNTAFLLDYGDTAFARYSAYDSDRQAQSRLAWYVWDVTLPHITWEHMITDGSALCLIGQAGESDVDRVSTVYYSPVGIQDDTLQELAADSYGENVFVPRAVRSTFATKLFHFDRPELYKQIGQVWLELGGEPESSLTLSYLTEQGTVRDGGDAVCTALPDTAAIRSCRFTPNVGRVSRFGLRGDSVGAVCISGLALAYKQGGGIR